eukprot:scaffold103638_cov89-Phaeocystis_antarctica.AAC.1
MSQATRQAKRTPQHRASSTHLGDDLQCVQPAMLLVGLPLHELTMPNALAEVSEEADLAITL